MTKRFMIFGAGFSGIALGRELAGEAEFVGGTTRDPRKAERLEQAGITPFLFVAGTPPSPELLEALATTTHLVLSIAPEAGRDPVLAALGETVAEAMPRLKWIGYLSTVGVYGDHGGAWVTEESECHPVSERSRQRVEAEAAWIETGRKQDIPVAILRLSGIYGPGRNAILSLSLGNARRIVKPGQVFNRIHVDDITGATAHLARRREGGIFNITDDAPSPAPHVIEHAAKLMGIEPPPEVPFEEADLTPFGRSFYGECKRVANAKLKATGYRLRHPDYRTALDAMWAEDRWKGDDL